MKTAITVRRPHRLPAGFVATLLIAAVLGMPPVAIAQSGSVDISKAQEECFIRVPYPLVEALIQPQEEVQIAKVYFRAVQGPHFYAIEMAWATDPAGYEAVLPVPGPDTAQVLYYVEAITPDFNAARTAEYTVDVVKEGECDERLFGGDDPEIVIYATEEGAPALPIGFLAVGVAAAVTAGGVSTAVGAGGGLSAGAVGGIVAGGAVGGVLVAEELDDDPPMEDEPEPPASPTGGN